MKRIIIVIFSVGALAGLGFYMARPKDQAAPAVDTAVESEPATPPQTETAPPPPAVLRSEGPPPVSAAPNISKPETRSAVVSVNPAVDASMVARAVDLLVSPRSSYQQKRDVFKQLREAGKLDQAISELEQRAANNPNAAEFPAALGQAYLQKCAIVKDVREQGILAMQADKVFDTALSLDPANWEARFTKAVAMSYWPPMLNKGDEVIQHFQTLIDQQETQAPQADFANTYLWLGDQYQKAGRTNDAVAVWQRGAGMYPADEKLRGKIAGTP